MAERFARNKTTGERLQLVNNEWVPVKQVLDEEKRLGDGMSLHGQAALGVGETALSAVTGAIATPVAGLAGLASLPFIGADAAADRVRGIQEGMTYTPSSRAAESIQGAVAAPFQKWSEAADAVGDAVLKRTDSPGWATAAKTGVEGLPDIALTLLGMRGAKPTLKPHANPDVQLLRDAGVPVTRAQAGSNVMENMKLSADTIFGPDDAFNATQSKAYNAAVLKKAGFTGDDVSTEALGRMRREVSADYNDLTSRVDTKLDQDLQSDLAAIKQQAEIDLEPDALRVIQNQIHNILDKGGAFSGQSAAIPGTAAQSIRESLGRLHGEGGSKGHFGKLLKDALDASYVRHAPPADAAKMKATRGKYQTLEQLEAAMANNSTRNVSPSKLYNSVDDKSQRGSGLLEIARAGKNVLPDGVGNSGTPARVAGLSTIGSMFTHPVQALKTGATLGAGRVLNRRPDAGLARPGMKAAGVAGVVSGSGEALLAEQRQRIDAYLRAIGAR